MTNEDKALTLLETRILIRLNLMKKYLLSTRTLVNHQDWSIKRVLLFLLRRTRLAAIIFEPSSVHFDFTDKRNDT